MSHESLDSREISVEVGNGDDDSCELPRPDFCCVDPIEDAEKESSVRVLQTFEVRFEGEESGKTWAGDPHSGRDDEILPKLGLIAFKCSSLWFFSEESGEIPSSNGHVNVSDIKHSENKVLSRLMILSLSFDEFDVLG